MTGDAKGGMTAPISRSVGEWGLRSGPGLSARTGSNFATVQFQKTIYPKLVAHISFDKLRKPLFRGSVSPFLATDGG